MIRNDIKVDQATINRGLSLVRYLLQIGPIIVLCVYGLNTPAFEIRNFIQMRIFTNENAQNDNTNKDLQTSTNLA